MRFLGFGKDRKVDAAQSENLRGSGGHTARLKGIVEAQRKEQPNLQRLKLPPAVPIKIAESVETPLEAEKKTEESAPPVMETKPVEAPVAQSTPEPEPEAVEEPRHVAMSARTSNFQAISRVTNELEGQLRELADRVEVTRHMWSVMKPYAEELEVETRRADYLENDRLVMSGEFARLKRSHDRLNKELSSRAGELAAVNQRLADVQSECDRLRGAYNDASDLSDQLHADWSRANAEISHLRSQITVFGEQLERERVNRENAERLRSEMSEKHSRLQQAETQTRNRFIEIQLQNEKLLERLPKLVAEQESLHSQLAAAGHERGILMNNTSAQQERIMLLERELEELQSQTASMGYAAKTELEVSLGAQRSAERARDEAETRFKDVLSRLREAESIQRANDGEVAKMQREIELAKKESVHALGKLSDLNLKYMTDLLALEQQREENRQLQRNLEMASAENARLAKIEGLYRAAEVRIAALTGEPLSSQRSADDDEQEMDIGTPGWRPANDAVELHETWERRVAEPRPEGFASR